MIKVNKKKSQGDKYFEMEEVTYMMKTKFISTIIWKDSLLLAYVLSARQSHFWNP
jgi:hypothetical protein